MTEQVTRLDNGLLVVSDPVPHVATVTVGVWVRCGSRDEAEEVNGISHFLEHMLFKGTSSKDAFAIAAEIENRGGSIDACTDFEATAYYVQTGARHWPAAVALLSEILMDSVFPEAEVERDRQVVLQEIDQYTDEPEAVLADALHATLYPHQPLGRPILGTRKHVEGFTRRHLTGHLAGHYRPGRMALVASGRVEHAGLVAQAARLFGGLAAQEPPPPCPARLVGGRTLLSRDIEQAHHALAFEGAAFGQPELPVLRHMANLLGGGMTSRLFQEIRERRGLAYDVHAEVEAYADSGYLLFEAATTPERLDDLQDVLIRELERARRGFSAEELARSKEQLRFMLGASQESTFGRAQRLARDALFRDRIRSVGEIETAFDQVTLEALDGLAERVLSGPPTVCGIGPDGSKSRHRPARHRS